MLVVVDYKPRHMPDMAALRAGDLTEVLNFAALSNVALQLPHLRLMGVHGWEQLGSALVQRYMYDISSKQVRAA